MKEAQRLLREAATALHAELVYADGGDAVIMKVGHTEFGLTLHQGPAGSHVVGRIVLRRIVPDQDARQVLLGMYLSADLHAATNFPVWCALDPDDDALCMYFGCSTGISAKEFAALIRNVAALPSHEALMAMHEL